MTMVTVVTVILMVCETPSPSSRPSRKENYMKSVQIPYKLFVALVEYHLAYDDDCAEEIRQGLEQKLDALVRHGCMQNIRLRPLQKSGNRPGRNTWTSVECSRIFGGEIGFHPD